MTTTLPPTVPSVLLPELLGFVPQFLLDDIIDTANDEVRQAVEAMEGFLRKWVEERSKKVTGEWDSTQDVEQGLVAFQTLLYSHVDIAFDFFEAWSLRNIFAIPADLPIIAPHQQGLDLDQPPDEEAKLLAEIDELRRKITAQRKLQRLYNLAVRKSALECAHSENRLQRLSYLRSPQLQTLFKLPSSFLSMYETVASLPPHDPSTSEDLIMPLPEPGKRPWETSKTGYLNWAVGQLMARSKEGEGGSNNGGVGVGGGGEGSSAVGAAAAAAYEVANAGDVKALLATMDVRGSSPLHSQTSQGGDQMDVR